MPLCDGVAACPGTAGREGWESCSGEGWGRAFPKLRGLLGETVLTAPWHSAFHFPGVLHHHDGSWYFQIRCRGQCWQQGPWLGVSRPVLGCPWLSLGVPLLPWWGGCQREGSPGDGLPQEPSPAVPAPPAPHVRPGSPPWARALLMTPITSSHRLLGFFLRFQILLYRQLHTAALPREITLISCLVRRLGRGELTRLCLVFSRKQELLNSADVTAPERPLSPPLTAPPTMKVRSLVLEHPEAFHLSGCPSQRAPACPCKPSCPTCSGHLASQGSHPLEQQDICPAVPVA